jgi:three-Cys-motif partner protein
LRGAAVAESIVGPWARDKLDRLTKYLRAYTAIMRRQQWCREYVYIDAFAGPGTHAIRQAAHRSDPLQDALQGLAQHSSADGDQHEFVLGSPRVALGLEHPFTSYVFVDNQPERITQLKQLKAEYGDDRRIVIREGDCNAFLRKRVVQNPQVDWRTWRFLVFLDPFGMQVPWDTIRALGETKAVEVFLNFPVGMAIQRLLLRSGTFTDKQRKKLDAYFGSPEWYDVLYRDEPDLFGQSSPVKVEASEKALVQWYRRRLQQSFGHASKAALIRNTKGGHLYYLMLATPNETGLRIANAILTPGETV